jgi:hypothetical protein
MSQDMETKSKEHEHSYIVIHPNVTFQGRSIESIPSRWQNFSLARLKALITVFSNFWLSNWLERNLNRGGHDGNRVSGMMVL